MLILQEPSLSDPAPCPYFSGKTAVNEYFFALQIEAEELDALLAQGWRKFGYYYFRPACTSCSACVPLRVPTAQFTPEKSWRRVIQRNAPVEAGFGPLRYSAEIFDIYREHSMDRFGMEASEEDFILSFYQQSCPAVQSEYYLGERLMAVGFLDRSSEALSSVYFIYRSEFSRFSPGNYSVIREIEYARSLGLAYYYLGYYIRENRRMAYKGRFRPNEIFSWTEKKWVEDA